MSINYDPITPLHSLDESTRLVWCKTNGRDCRWCGRYECIYHGENKEQIKDESEVS